MSNSAKELSWGRGKTRGENNNKNIMNKNRKRIRNDGMNEYYILFSETVVHDMRIRRQKI